MKLDLYCILCTKNPFKMEYKLETIETLGENTVEKPDGIGLCNDFLAVT